MARVQGTGDASDGNKHHCAVIREEQDCEGANRPSEVGALCPADRPGKDAAPRTRNVNESMGGPRQPAINLPPIPFQLPDPQQRPPLNDSNRTHIILLSKTIYAALSTITASSQAGKPEVHSSRQSEVN